MSNGLGLAFAPKQSSSLLYSRWKIQSKSEVKSDVGFGEKTNTIPQWTNDAEVVSWMTQILRKDLLMI